jgi:hypothetical protein
MSVAAHKFGGMTMVVVFGGTGAGVVDVGRPTVLVAEAALGVVGLLLCPAALVV